MINMKQKLEDYTSGKINYTTLLSIFMGNRDKDWYEELGKYICSKIDISTIPSLRFFADKIKESPLKKIKDFTGFNDRTYSSIGIFFLTGTLDFETLKKLFGEPILHNKFGEGFDKEYKIKEDYASWFVNVDGLELHIGYDHQVQTLKLIYHLI